MSEGFIFKILYISLLKAEKNEAKVSFEEQSRKSNNDV